MAAFPDELDSKWQKDTRRLLLAWYRRHSRALPWRESADPYLVWISEIMLQQTTIAAVMPYFERFREQFPTVQDLAAAEQQEVLRLWEGLGYYSRARNLHRAAQQIVDEHAGQFPQTVDGLQSLPGIGPYTARAIASVALGQSVGILEANTLRLYSRLIGLESDPRATAGNRLLWQFADWIVSPRAASSFNQAAMDLGSMVCTPDNPECPQCPLKSGCVAFRQEQQHELPVAPAAKTFTEVTEAAFVLHKGSRVLMRQYTDGERWAGLWDFVRVPVSAEVGDQLLTLPRNGSTQPVLFASEGSDAAVEQVQQACGLTPQTPAFLKQIRHTVTRYKIRLLVIRSNTVQGRLQVDHNWVWKPQSELAELPLSTTARRIADLLPAVSPAEHASG